MVTTPHYMLDIQSEVTVSYSEYSYTQKHCRCKLNSYTLNYSYDLKRLTANVKLQGQTATVRSQLLTNISQIIMSISKSSYNILSQVSTTG